MTGKYPEHEVEPFYPKHFKRHIWLALFIVLIMVLLATFGIKVQQETEPVFTSMVPQPDWLFFLLFQSTRYLKGWQESIGTIGIPLAIFLGMFLVPIIDKRHFRGKKLRGLLLVGGILTVTIISVFTVHTSSTTPIWGCTSCHKAGFGSTFSDAPNRVDKLTTELDNKWLAVHYQYPQYWWMFNADQDPSRW